MKAPSKLILPPSLWSATARPPALTQALAENKRVDVAIVGAGYTGLVTAPGRVGCQCLCAGCG